jgi:prevent-host-death family protein
MGIVNMLEAKTQLSKLVEAVESGAETEIIIARNGKPAARLVPIEEKSVQPRPLGLAEGKYAPIDWVAWDRMDAEIAKGFEDSEIFPSETGNVDAASS